MSERPDRVGDYEIEAELGAGGMATVYRARHVHLDTLHALKVLDPSYRVRPEARQRFLDEARIQASRLDHPNIVKVTGIVATPEHAALVMELVEGGNLEAEAARLKHRPDELRRIMLAVLDAVGHAHAAGIIHRDLKPANVLLARKDGALVPKVTDFGIAKVTADAAGKGKKSTHGDARMGTLAYMSPEQIRRAKDVTVRSDIFSLGAMLYELATGEVPFGGDSEYDVMENVVNGRYPAPEALHEGIDPALAAVIRRALEPDPARRFASCAEMAAALGGAAAPSGKLSDNRTASAAAPAAAAASATPAASRARWPVLAGLILAGVVLGGGGVYLATRDGGDRTVSPATRADAGDLVAVTDPAQAGPVDAAVLTPPAPADAAIFTPSAPSAPVDAGATSRLQALLGDAGATPPRPPPAPPNPCRGTRFFGRPPTDWTVAVTSRSSGTCGEIYMYDRTVMKPGVRTCHAPLRGCRVSGTTLTATFGCTYNLLPVETRSGAVTLTCAGGRVTVRTPYGTRTAN